MVNVACNHAIDVKMYGIALLLPKKHFGILYILIGDHSCPLVGNGPNNLAFHVFSTLTTFAMHNIYFATKRPVTCEKHVSNKYQAPQCLTRLANVQLM